MKILHIIFAILSALLAGWCIQLTGRLTGVMQMIEYATAIFDAGLCFWHIFKLMEEAK